MPEPRDSQQTLVPELSAVQPLHLDVVGLMQLSQPVALIDAELGVIAANRAFLSEPCLLEPGSQSLSAQIVVALGKLDGMAGGFVGEVTFKPSKGARAFDLLALSLSREGNRLLFLTDHSIDTEWRNALIESRARFKDLVAISSDYAWETGADRCFTAISPKGLAGLGAQQLIGRLPDDLLDPERPAPPVLPFATPVPVNGVSLWLRHADGRSLCFEVAALPLYDRKGAWAGARGVCRDVTESQRQKASLASKRNAERLFTRITSIFHSQANPDDMLRVAASTCTHGFSANGSQILVTTTPLVKGITKVVLEVMAAFGSCGSRSETDQAVAQLPKARGDASRIVELVDWSLLVAPTIYAGNLIGAVLLWRNRERPAWTAEDARLLQNVAGQLAVAIQQRTNYHVLLDVSRTDPLTGLLNRRAFYEEVQRRFHRLRRSGHLAAMVYADLDNFKLVNDRYGHKKGDDILRQMADILRGNTRSVDLVARLGGDEFAVWLDDADEEVALRRAQIFMMAGEVLEHSSGSADKPLKISMGIAVYDPTLNEDINQFVSRADAAMYAVKRQGKGNFGLAPPAKPGRKRS
ncbi:MAG TPA: diguanylate cyclase [Rhodospirillaceae bacterium]|nr:diguanylate cyclase [Rhodospirillaceae bacterium]